MIRKLFILLLNTAFALGISWLHVSDIHVDTNYKVNSSSKCLIGTKLGTLCCNRFQIPLHGEPCEKYGMINNDVPMSLVNGIFEWISNNIVNIDLVVNTGDSGSHHDVRQFFSDDIKNSIDFISDSLNSNFPNIPILHTIGNHDAFYTVDQTFPGYKKFLKQISLPWTKWITDVNLEQYGYYSYILDNYTFVVLNNLYYDNHNIFEVNSSIRDRGMTGSQFQWLDNVLSKNENIILVYHIPFMGGEANEYFNLNIKQIYKKYNDKILITLNGHSHTDHFLLFFEKLSSEYLTYSMVNPSIMPDAHYPIFRVYNIDKINSIDYTQYFCNLTESNLRGKVTCDEQYTFSKAYNISGVSLKNMIELYNDMHVSKYTYDTFVKNYAYPNRQNINYYDEILNLF